MLTLLFIITCNIFSVTLAAEPPYCFRFTWVGPFLHKDKIGDLTCDDLTKDLNTIPCQYPLVATANENGNDTIPDTAALWGTYSHSPNLFGCPMNPGETCIKYTHIYNKGIQNITYMCGKVNATDGCYRQKFISGAEVEVCVCQSLSGMRPCNYGNKMQKSAILLFASISTSIIFTHIASMSRAL